MDGPDSFTGCATITDDELRRRRVDDQRRVPRGLFYDSTAGSVFWSSSCASSVDEASSRGVPSGMARLLGAGESDWERSATFCDFGVDGIGMPGGKRLTQKYVSCDYFDGTKLSDTDPSNYLLFASLLWWQDQWHWLGSSAILGYSVEIGSATDTVELCTLDSTTYYLERCHDLTLYRQRYRITHSGEVTVEQPELLRSVIGDCD